MQSSDIFLHLFLLRLLIVSVRELSLKNCKELLGVWGLGLYLFLCLIWVIFRLRSHFQIHVQTLSYVIFLLMTLLQIFNFLGAVLILKNWLEGNSCFDIFDQIIFWIYFFVFSFLFFRLFVYAVCDREEEIMIEPSFERIEELYLDPSRIKRQSFLTFYNDNKKMIHEHPFIEKEFEFLREKCAKLSEEDQACPICLGDFEKGVDTCSIGCSHHFHYDCLVLWVEKKPSCPICRENFRFHLIKDLWEKNQQEPSIAL